MEAHAGKPYHLGIGKSVTRSNLSKANKQRNYRIFEEYTTFMIAEARKCRINKIFELDGHVYAFDSTTLSVFEWAKFRKHKGGINMKLEHSIYEVLQIVGISLTDKTHLSDLFDKSNFKNVKDRYDSSEPNLLNF